MESVGKAGQTVTEGNSSSLSFTLSMELTPGLSSQSLKKKDNFNPFKVLTPFTDQIYRKMRKNLLICAINKEGEQTNRTSHKDHPDNSVKKVLTIHKVSDAMNSGLL